MQINQQVCRKMEELDKVDENGPDDTQVCLAQNVHVSYVFS